MHRQLYYWFRYCTLLYGGCPQERRKQGVSGKTVRFLVCFKTHLKIPTGKVGDFRGAEITRCVLKPDSRRSAVNWGFFGGCGNLRVCFKAHLSYCQRTIVLPQITNAMSSIRTAAVAKGDSPAVGNTIELLFLNQRIRFPV